LQIGALEKENGGYLKNSNLYALSQNGIFAISSSSFYKTAMKVFKCTAGELDELFHHFPAVLITSPLTLKKGSYLGGKEITLLEDDHLLSDTAYCMISPKIINEVRDDMEWNNLYE
jgi:hypothetical protein